MPLYAVSVKRLWLILSHLDPVMSRSECLKRIESLTSPSSAPLYYRAMKAWGLIFEAGGRVEVRKISSYSELARLVYKNVVDDVGRELIDVLMELASQSITPRAEVVWRMLRERGRDVSLWKVALALRLLRACGVIRRAPLIVSPPEDDSQLLLRLIRERGSLTLESLYRAASRLYGLNESDVDRALLTLIARGLVSVDVPSNALLSLALERQSPSFRLKLDEVPDELKAELSRLEELGLVRVSGEWIEVVRPWDDSSLIVPSSRRSRTDSSRSQDTR